jgi:transcriptional regulator with XRE-family HTH domain
MFINTIRQRRQELGLSQTRLACMLGIAESTLSDVELGKRQPWPKVRKALARTLNVPERQLFPEG